MLRREEAERHSDAVQAAFGVAEAAGSETDWLEVVSAMQARVVVEAGVPSERRAAALWLLRSAASGVLSGRVTGASGGAAERVQAAPLQPAGARPDRRGRAADVRPRTHVKRDSQTVTSSKLVPNSWTV